MSELKTINIDGRVLGYKVCHDVGELESYSWTEFYEGAVPVTRRKYWLFGEKITVHQPKLIFKISRDIEDTSYTKSQVRAWIYHQLELMGRAEEIKRGEII